VLYPEEEPHCQAEMVIRPELALVYLEMGRLDDAVAEVSRCREVSAGEDWRGLEATSRAQMLRSPPRRAKRIRPWWALRTQSRFSESTHCLGRKRILFSAGGGPC